MKIQNFGNSEETPFLVINLKRVEKNYEELKNVFPFAKIYYAVKANPDKEVIKTLAKKGSNFDIATVWELKQLLDLGISPEKISYGNTIKKEKDIAFAYKQGVRLFATDSADDLEKIAKNAPGSKVFFRLLCENSGADWPLSRKFGAHSDVIFNLAIKAKEKGLEPYGLSFHVGSQQRDIGQWDNVISQCKYLFDSLAREGIKLKMINMGGGFPTKYINPTKNLSEYAKEISRFLREDFGFNNFPEIIIEPGRSIVGDAGIIISEVILISKKSPSNNYSWLYVDVGKFGGLIETIEESIKYPIFTNHNIRKLLKEDLEEYIIAGPTCDSMDILYENHLYKLSKNLTAKDRVYFLSTGAYTASYSSVEFNGFPPLKVYTVESL